MLIIFFKIALPFELLANFLFKDPLFGFHFTTC